MMMQEETKLMWSHLRYLLSDNGGRSNVVMRVEWEEDGETVEYTQQEDIKWVVSEETQECFTLATSSPLCTGYWEKSWVTWLTLKSPSLS